MATTAGPRLSNCEHDIVNEFIKAGAAFSTCAYGAEELSHGCRFHCMGVSILITEGKTNPGQLLFNSIQPASGRLNKLQALHF